MTLARVVSFDGVGSDRVAEMQQRMQQEGPPPELNASEIIVLHDPESQTSLVILFFEDEDDYKRGDEILNAMPPGDTPGERSGVSRYEVVHRMTT